MRESFCNAIAGGGDDSGPEVLLFHYERQSDGSWLLRGQIAAASAHYPLYWRLALKNGVGVFDGFESADSGADEHRLEHHAASTQPLCVGHRDSRPGDCGRVRKWTNAVVHFLEKQAGQWAIAKTVQGAPGFNDDEWVGPEIELATNELTAGKI